MSKINVLTSKIYNRISAGEVVERPSSVVKELVENSIDAGADSITVEIVDGGISRISIIDNGSGIEKSELKKAVLPHATSKLSTVKDLDNIRTLGFRGEALASIAAISKLTIISKPKEQEIGASITVNGGDIENVIDSPSFDGTEITVNNLFYNTPAREKFLKTPRGEENEISSVMSRFILGNPNISFKYVADGKIVYQSYGDGLESAMVKIYGLDVINNCLKVETEKNGINISGYIGKSNFTKSNRSYQTVFINGRYVLNHTIASAISNAYSSYMMKRQYPFYVLSIKLSTEIVDVNVHPNKIDVRFSNNQVIYGTLYSVISKVLDGMSEALSIVKEDKKNTSENKYDYVTHNLYNTTKTEEKFNRLVFNDSGIYGKANSLGANFAIKESDKTADDIFKENKAYLDKLEQIKKERAENNHVQEQISIERDLNYIGQALNTFLFFDDGEDLFVIDQHAAHERILYDKFIEQVNNNSVYVQSLFIPYVLNVNSFEYSFLLENIDVLNKIGIEIEEFGVNTFRVLSVPICLADINLGKFFEDVTSDFTNLKSVTLSTALKERIAQKACKAAIKSGDKLTDKDIGVLMEQIKMNFGLKCPHGRPIAVKISRNEIDKWFKRIV